MTSINIGNSDKSAEIHSTPVFPASQTASRLAVQPVKSMRNVLKLELQKLQNNHTFNC